MQSFARSSSCVRPGNDSSLRLPAGRRGQRCRSTRPITPNTHLVLASSTPQGSGCSQSQDHRRSRRELLSSGALIGFAGSLTLGVQKGSAAGNPVAIVAGVETEKEPFLQSAGDRGPLSLEEAKLLELRRVREREAQRELQARIEELEAQIQASDTKASPFCATPYGVDVLGITEFIALLGALFGGISARQRKTEVERLNNRLRDINQQLRRQARAGIAYAPGLTYAPPSVITGTAPTEAAPAPLPAALMTNTFDEETGSPPTVEELEMQRTMKEGKRLLKEGNGPAALVRFEKAVMLSRATGNKIMQRRAFRGLAAAERLQGQRMAAIRHFLVVVQISKEIGDSFGDADAYGSIADIYADMNDMDNAAKYYDLYLAEMKNVENKE